MTDRKTKSTITPVTISGWYEHADGTVGRYQWRDGQLTLVCTAADWAAAAEYDRATEAGEAEYAEYQRQRDAEVSR